MPRFKTEEKVVKSIHSAWLDSWIAIKAVMKVRTFQIIVMQGLVGSLPWMAMVFFTMWLELIGETPHRLYLPALGMRCMTE